jgi:hypothetical protein
MIVESEAGGSLRPAGSTHRRVRGGRCVVCLLAAGGTILAVASPAGTTTATATISAGSLAFVSTPANVIFAATLSGLDQTPINQEAIDVGDPGSGTGWNLTATSTTFTTGTQTLATSATTLTTAPADTCDASATCTLATNAITYPYTLPAAATPPTATKLFNSAVNSGMGDQTVTPTWKLSIPASTFAGTYLSTWTISLVSGP